MRPTHPLSRVFSFGLMLCGLALWGPALPAHAAEPGACSNASASVGISSISYNSSAQRVEASGTWSVTNADAIRLDYSVDSVVRDSELHLGTSGTWSASIPVPCNNGGHSFQVTGFPAIDQGSSFGICLSKSTSATRFILACCTPPDPNATIVSCDWNCSGDFCSGFCEGEATGSHPPFSGDWRTILGRICVLTFDGLSAQCACDPSRDEDIVFTVTDSLGNKDSDTLACGATPPRRPLCQ